MRRAAVALLSSLIGLLLIACGEPKVKTKDGQTVPLNKGWYEFGVHRGGSHLMLAQKMRFSLSEAELAQTVDDVLYEHGYYHPAMIGKVPGSAVALDDSHYFSCQQGASDYRAGRHSGLKVQLLNPPPY
jgi:hypothetical protein